MRDFERPGCGRMIHRRLPAGRSARLAACLIGLIAVSMVGCATATEPDAGEERELRVSVEAPTPCWGVAIEEVHAGPKALLVVAEMQPPPPDLMCAQVISRAEDAVTLRAPALPVRVLVLGHPWAESNDPAYTHVPSREVLDVLIAGARRLDVPAGN